MPEPAHNDNPAVSPLKAELLELAQSLLGENEAGPIHSAVFRIESEKAGLCVEGAVGTARPDLPDAIAPQMAFHTASIAKVLTAVSILQLLEQGHIGPDGLDTRLADTGVFDPDIMARVLLKDGLSLGETITINHLLRHMSGMRDAMVDDATLCSADAGGPAPNSLIGRIFAEPTRAKLFWNPWDPTLPNIADAGTFNYYLNNDGVAAAALSEPGTQFHYSDTGYVILGLLVEHLSGVALDEYFREQIYVPLGMQSSYLAYRDDPILGPERQPELETWAGEIPCLAAGFDLSFDWGGGGLVSTTADLIRLLRGIVTGQCFSKPETAKMMMEWQSPEGLKAPRRAVGRGLFQIEGGSDHLLGHSGAWGGKLFFDPQTEVYFAGSVNQSGAPADWFYPLIDRVNAHVKRG
ncbi:serine hydrolase domain-containing protein [Alterisphingorhabdus coralli]|uniref:Serine hydrolase domain-containing protein n=1 Tax=Alterisphingorhabdus coralli TaxID=3071408 RepID=A0AA97F8L3_9SPHN|nr:serine hydrolase domain-containing protein [Parasphingorhabdus sp. SCSIO 66989]WOE75501.1 serine hydrolase domain-containing protein [Parasphingorhabdus sp. SCSIO 66989]